MNDIQIIQSKIYVIRGQRVMLDFDDTIQMYVKARTGIGSLSVVVCCHLTESTVLTSASWLRLG